MEVQHKAMDLQSSHLAAALMAGSNYTNAQSEPEPTTSSANNISEQTKSVKHVEQPKLPSEEDKEEMASGEEFTDEVSYHIKFFPIP